MLRKSYICCKILLHSDMSCCHAVCLNVCTKYLNWKEIIRKTFLTLSDSWIYATQLTAEWTTSRCIDTEVWDNIKTDIDIVVHLCIGLQVMISIVIVIWTDFKLYRHCWKHHGYDWWLVQTVGSFIMKCNKPYQYIFIKSFKREGGFILRNVSDMGKRSGWRSLPCLGQTMPARLNHYL